MAEVLSSGLDFELVPTEDIQIAAIDAMLGGM